VGIVVASVKLLSLTLGIWKCNRLTKLMVVMLRNRRTPLSGRWRRHMTSTESTGRVREGGSWRQTRNVGFWR